MSIILYKYTLEISPYVKNMATYFAEKGNNVRIITDSLPRSKGFTFTDNNIEIKNLHIKDIPNNRIKNLLHYNAENARRKRFVRKLEKELIDQDIFFALEFLDYDLAVKAGANISNVIVFITEGFSSCSGYSCKYIKSMLDKARKIIFTDKGRYSDFTKRLGYNIDESKIQYLPVACRSCYSINKGELVIKQDHKINFIYSGYFAEWACVKEIAASFKKYKKMDIALTLQGHWMGTDSYLSDILKQIKGYKTIEFDNNFYNDDHYYRYLSKYDIGIALYKDNQFTKETNSFMDILLSSGKIASYICSGLPVITSIRDEMTLRPPFFYMDEINADNFAAIAEKYRSNVSLYTNAAHNLANSVYNFDKYIGKIEKAIL